MRCGHSGDCQCYGFDEAKMRFDVTMCIDWRVIEAIYIYIYIYAMVPMTFVIGLLAWKVTVLTLSRTLDGFNGHRLSRLSSWQFQTVISCLLLKAAICYGASS